MGWGEEEARAGHVWKTGGSCKEGVGFAVTREKKYDDGDGANFVNVF